MVVYDRRFCKKLLSRGGTLGHVEACLPTYIPACLVASRKEGEKYDKG